MDGPVDTSVAFCTSGKNTLISHSSFQTLMNNKPQENAYLEDRKTLPMP